MASPLNEMGLDIGPFKKALNEAKAEVKQLEPQLKAATAELARMEQAFRKSGAASGITTKQIDRQAEAVQDLRAKLRGARADAKAFEQGLGQGSSKGGGLLGQIRTVVTGGVLANFVKDIATTGRAGDDLTKTLNDLNYTGTSDTFDRYGNSANGLKGRWLDLVAAIRNSPILGDLVKAGTAITGLDADVARNKMTMDVTRATTEKTGGMNDAISQFKELTALRTKLQEMADREAANTGITLETAHNIKNVDDARESLAKSIAKFSREEVESRNASLAGSLESARIGAIELQQREKLAALENSLRDANGGISSEAREALKAGSAQIRRDAEEAIELAKDQAVLQASAMREAKAMADLNLRGAQGEVEAASRLLKLAEERQRISLGQGREVQEQERVNVAIAKDRLKLAQETRDDEIKAVQLANDEMVARLRGEDQLADRLAIQARYQQQITNAQRSGNEVLKAQLETQRDMALLEQQAAEHDVTPRQKREARKRSRDVLRKARQQNEREDANRRDAARGVRGRRIDEQIAKDGGIVAGRDKAINAAMNPKSQDAALLKVYQNIDQIKNALVPNS